MALLAEALVEGWLNRQHFFTMRGIKVGVDEMDLLAIRNTENGIEARHYEVQVSTNPVAYISKLTAEQSKELGKARGSAFSREDSVLEKSVKEWVDKKFTNQKKRKVREQLCPGVKWSYHFIHGEVRHPQELKLIEQHDIEVVGFRTVIEDQLRNDKEASFKGGPGSDIVEMMAYLRKYG
ncbi:hypothetical protein [Polynucleobacter sp.]|jgi:hypothetical protein|uniref:hypothetical protein n=1 Tax=Polynucleobacter sp. TaxID=2029855 RepID=UPI0025861DF9|nr:hypothetical protein [Polynucleobacter sp.]MCX7237129.1 hypothetical protein [Polynucleobacter sp.]